MDATIILLRVIHILSGVFWAGATFFLVGFLQPVVAASGPEGGRLMQRLTSQKRFQMAMPVAAGLAVIGAVVNFAFGRPAIRLIGSAATFLTVSALWRLVVSMM